MTDPVSDDGPPKRPPRVVIIEDDDTMREMIGHMLERGGYKVVMTSRAEHAIDLIAGVQMDLVLTDIFMPGMGGIEAIQRLRESNPELPIIAMSAGFQEVSGEHATRAAMKMGAVAVVDKPIARDQLFQVIEDVLSADAGPDDDAAT